MIWKLIYLLFYGAWMIFKLTVMFIFAVFLSLLILVVW